MIATLCCLPLALTSGHRLSSEGFEVVPNVIDAELIE